MSASVALTDQALVTALGDFLTLITLAGTVIVLGQVNQVPEPGAADFVVMTPVSRNRLAYNIDTWIATGEPTTQQAETHERVEFQLDVHGPKGADNAQIIETLWQDDYACSWFDNNGIAARPLYANDATQAPFINGEDQYEDRWIVRVALQGNFLVSTPQQFADSLAIGIISVDATYPPGS